VNDKSGDANVWIRAAGWRVVYGQYYHVCKDDGPMYEADIPAAVSGDSEWRITCPGCGSVYRDGSR